MPKAEAQSPKPNAESRKSQVESRKSSSTMAKDTFQCSVITPEAAIFEGAVKFVSLPVHDGQIGILPQRAPLLAKLGSGKLRVESDGDHQVWFVDAGFAQMIDNQLTILTQTALRPEQLDRAAAQKMLEGSRGIVATDDVAARKKQRLQDSARARLNMAR